MKKVIPADATLIPPQATKVFAGSIYDVYQWQQPRYDGNEVTYEMLKRPDTVQFVCIKDDKLIALEEQQSGRPSLFRLPGGRVEPGESWEAAAKRECREELGMLFHHWKLVEVRQPIVKIEWFVATFVATGLLETREARPDAGEKIDLLEMTVEEFRQRLDKELQPMADYARNLFAKAKSVESLKKLPEFAGLEVDR